MYGVIIMTNRIRELRKQRGITMKQLGEVVDLAESTISQYETGKREPDNETLLKISEYFGVTVGYLLGAESEKTPTESGERKMSDAELKFALWGDCADVNDEDLADVRRYAAFVRERKKGQQ